ncbi:TPA: hypothetical protein ACGBPE_004471 [Escherichia coli]
MLPIFVNSEESPYNPIQGDNTPHFTVWECLNPTLQDLGIHPQQGDRKPSIKSLLDSKIIYHEDHTPKGREIKVVHLDEMNTARLEKYIIWQINHFRTTGGFFLEFTDVVNLFESVNGLEYYLLLAILDRFENEGLLDVKLVPSLNPNRSKKLYSPSNRLPRKPRNSTFGFRVPAFCNLAWERPTYAWIERVFKTVGLKDPTPAMVDLFYYLTLVAEWTNAGLVAFDTYCRSQEQISIALGYPVPTVKKLCNKLKGVGLLDFTNKAVNGTYVYGVDTNIFKLEEPPAIITDMPFSFDKEEVEKYCNTYFDKELPGKHFMKGERYFIDFELWLNRISDKRSNASYISTRANSGKR